MVSIPTNGRYTDLSGSPASSSSSSYSSLAQVMRTMRDKLIRLQKLYIEQFGRLQHKLRESRRTYLAQVPPGIPCQGSWLALRSPVPPVPSCPRLPLPVPTCPHLSPPSTWQVREEREAGMMSISCQPREELPYSRLKVTRVTGSPANIPVGI